MNEIRDRWITPGPQPNGLQSSDDGLWVIDQVDNALYKLDYDDGSVIARLPTETEHSSGVTEGGGFLWIASTYTLDLVKIDYEGRTMARYDTPGTGVIEGNDRRSGAHGLQWLDDQTMWIAVPPARRLFLVDTRTMETRHSIPTPDARPHGIFVHEGALWCADTTMKLIHKLNPDTGDVLDQIEVPDPEAHGLTLHDGEIWLCCATTRRVCTISLPS